MFQQIRGKNNRNSSSALAIQAKTKHEVLETVERPAPPESLLPAEKEIWRACVQSMAADWFPPPTLPLLVQYCRHTVHADGIAEMIHDAANSNRLTVEQYDLFLKMQERESKIIAQLSVKLRLCPQTMRNDRWNKVMEGNLNTNNPSAMPWDE